MKKTGKEYMKIDKESWKRKEGWKMERYIEEICSLISICVYNERFQVCIHHLALSIQLIDNFSKTRSTYVFFRH